jgi:2'-5' RNA ligase
MFSYSSVQINLPISLSKEIITWGQNHIPNKELSDDKDGREDEIHVTVLYGIHSESSYMAKRLLRQCKPFDIELKTIGVFTNNESFDVVKINVQSEEIKKINEKLCKSIQYTSKFPTYQPHVTIAYVKKGKGWKFNGDKTFNDRMFHVDTFIFSSKNGIKEQIKI